MASSTWSFPTFHPSPLIFASSDSTHPRSSIFYRKLQTTFQLMTYWGEKPVAFSISLNIHRFLLWFGWYHRLLLSSGCDQIVPVIWFSVFIHRHWPYLLISFMKTSMPECCMHGWWILHVYTWMAYYNFCSFSTHFLSVLHAWLQYTWWYFQPFIST